MKIRNAACLVTFLAAFAAVSLSHAQAADKPFSLVVEGDTLHIFAPDGKEVGTGLPPATIARAVDVPPYSCQISFGNDVNGNLSVIVSPNPEHPGPLNFTIRNRSVEMERGSVVTITLGNNDVTRIDPGLLGGVQVDNHAVMAAAGNFPTTTVATAPALAPVPASSPFSQPLANNTPGASNPNSQNANNPATSHDPNDDPTTPPLAVPSSQASFNSNPIAVAINNPVITTNPTTTPPLTTPF
jgi:hypothetical protein